MKEGFPDKSPQASITNIIQAKSMIGIPWRVALALIDSGWILRNDIIWHKPNSMPSSVKDRLTNMYEHIFHFVKSNKYYYNLDVIREPSKFEGKPFNVRVRDAQKGQLRSKWGILANASDREIESYNEMNYVPVTKLQGLGYLLGKNPGDLWAIPTKPFKGAHFAVYPEEVCVKPILSSCPEQVCVKCGTALTPMIRTIKTTSNGQPPPGTPSAGRKFELATDLGSSAGRRRFPVRYEVAREIIGSASCACNAGFRPGIVLDIFSGSGTTLAVAKRLGRHFIGIELNPAYVELAKSRLTSVSQ